MIAKGKKLVKIAERQLERMPQTGKGKERVKVWNTLKKQ